MFGIIRIFACLCSKLWRRHKKFNNCSRARLGRPKWRERLNEREMRFVSERMGKGDGQRLEWEFLFGGHWQAMDLQRERRAASSMSFASEIPRQAGRMRKLHNYFLTRRARCFASRCYSWWKSNRLLAVKEKEDGSLCLVTAL